MEKQSYLKNLLSKLFSSNNSVMPIANAQEVKTLTPDQIGAAIWDLESTKGTDPNTPGNTARTYTIPAANSNEKERFIKYQTGYGGQFGLTPDALAELAKSKVDKTSKQNSKGYTGFVPGIAPEEIQKALNTSTTTSANLATKYLLKDTDPSKITPEVAAQKYIDTYVTKGSPNYNKDNYNRALKVFSSQ